jgi:hypothetical protein
MENHAYRPAFDTPNEHLLAKIGMPAVMKFNFFADMGIMNGR